jgi:hypothetical protein
VTLPPVLTPAERLAAMPLPPLQCVDRLQFHSDDWLVICAGFEDRALAVLSQAVSCSTPPHVLLVRYDPPLPENRVPQIQELCSRFNIHPHVATYNRRDPTGFGRLLVEMLASRQGRLFIDVSAMSRLLIVQAIVALKQDGLGLSKCFIVYAQAATYPPSKAEAEAELSRTLNDPTACVLFLSSGVFDVTIVPELSSTAMIGSQSRVIAFPSLDAHHLLAIRAELQPSRFSFIEGTPPDQENQWRQSVIARINRLDQIADTEMLRTSTLHYNETLSCLLDLYASHGKREKLIISPTGSKMQAVAVGIFRSWVEDVQIVFPTPLGFVAPQNYTHGVGALYCLSLDAFECI